VAGALFERVDYYVWADIPAILNEICAVAGRPKKTSGKTGESLEIQERENLVKKVLPGLLTLWGAREVFKKMAILFEMCYG
jgi:hypothetical protein